jgi:hypothetical protein
LGGVDLSPHMFFKTPLQDPKSKKANSPPPTYNKIVVSLVVTTILFFLEIEIIVSIFLYTAGMGTESY